MFKKLGNIFKGDKVVWMIFFILCLVSIVEVFSASSFLTYKSGSYLGPLMRHITFIGLGTIAMLSIVYVPCRYFKIFTVPGLIVSFFLLLYVLVLGHATNGAARWIDLGFVQFQPSEMGKGAVILAVAQILSAFHTDEGTSRPAFWWVIIISGSIIVPIFFENFSTAALLSAVVLVMMFIARVSYDMLGKLIGTGLLAVVLAVTLVMALGEDHSQLSAQAKENSTLVEKTADDDAPRRGGLLHRFDTWKSRIMKFTNNNEVMPDEYDLDKDAQVAHANIAITKSNVIGRGPGNSEERDFLSQAFSDFIYAIIIEEMGIEGAAFVAILYVILFWRVGHIARNCANTFPAYLAMGIGLMMVFQAMFNMMVAVGMAPVTGQPLPLISRGGTSTIFNCVYLGVLLSISMSAKKREPAMQAQKTASKNI